MVIQYIMNSKLLMFWRVLDSNWNFPSPLDWNGLFDLLYTGHNIFYWHFLSICTLLDFHNMILYNNAVLLWFNTFHMSPWIRFLLVGRNRDNIITVKDIFYYVPLTICLVYQYNTYVYFSPNHQICFKRL